MILEMANLQRICSDKLITLFCFLAFSSERIILFHSGSGVAQKLKLKDRYGLFKLWGKSVGKIIHREMKRDVKLEERATQW